MRINFDFLDLETFLAVKETGSFHAASGRLGLSQSSVTRRVQKLEEALGADLFERTTRDVRPTLAGKRLQLRAEAMLQEARETTRSLRDESAAYSHQRAQTVTLATIPTVVSSIVAPAIETVQMSGVPLRVRLMDLAANEVAEAVAQGEAELGICSVPMLEPVTEFTQLFEDPLVVAVPSDHRLATCATVVWRDLEGEHLCLPARGTGNRLLIDEALARSETQIRWSFETGRTSTALDLVASGIAVAPVPKCAATSAATDRLTWKYIVDPSVSRPIGLLTRFGYEHTAAMDTLRRALLKMVERPSTNAHTQPIP